MGDLFPVSRGLIRGYDQEQVDAFFAQARDAYEGGVPAEAFSSEQIRAAAFSLVHGGYQVAEVDAALNRLEGAFIHRDRSAFVAEHGENAWFDKVADNATTLYPRLLRPEGERFRHPEAREQGYAVADVDSLVDRLAAFFDDRDTITEADLRTATFRPARGEKAYEERQVDAFIGRATQVLMAVS